MKSYRSIDKEVISNIYIYAFEKIDGSNIRAEWDRKKKFHKFGTRTRLVDHTDPIFGKVPNLVREHEKELSDVFMKKGLNDVTCYFEFHGPNSRFGQHNPNDNHVVTLIDVNLYKKGIIDPKDFIEWFPLARRAAMLYHGKADETFVKLVKGNTLTGMRVDWSEGVVCKSAGLNPVMFKIKTNEWMENLKKFCAGDEEMFRRLA